MKKVKRPLVGFGVVGIMLLTIFTTAMAASTLPNSEGKTTYNRWELKEQNIHENKRELPKKDIKVINKQNQIKESLYKQDNQVTQKSKARPEKFDSLNQGDK
ncbi:hypothetical protein J7E71_18715 [Mesobacillus foraminis]|uniref:hypothetical protein n=1 Tax=Mesobacillus foraminis TaxID=279826 RepID=UPI001BE97D62|nr:hypothetical protein [Mesobacillus foraminis]MBT2757913.1 hypothetical protein [Mesobacillus foraminis]